MKKDPQGRTLDADRLVRICAPSASPTNGCGCPTPTGFFAARRRPISLACFITASSTRHLAEIGRFEDEVTFDDYFSGFSGEFHELRGQSAFRDCLDPDSYVQSQQLAERLHAAGSLGVVYPSVRRSGRICLACFRPTLVGNVRKGPTHRFR